MSESTEIPKPIQVQRLAVGQSVTYYGLSSGFTVTRTSHGLNGTGERYLCALFRRGVGSEFRFYAVLEGDLVSLYVCPAAGRGFFPIEDLVEELRPAKPT